MNALSKNAETLEKASIYLEGQDSGFVVVEANDDAVRRQALDYFHSRLPKDSFRVVELKNSPPGRHPLDSVREAVAGAPDARVFFILDFHTLAGRDDDAPVRLLRRLNFNREAYSRLERVLVFFFPSFFVDLAMKHAKDFFDFVPVLFSLVSEAPILEWQSFGKEPVDPEFLKNRIAFLESVLASDEAIDGKRVEILKETALCHDQLAEYEKNRGNYRSALDLWEKSLQLWRKAGDLLGVGDRAGEGATLDNIGRIYWARGDYDAALKLLEQSLVIRREIGDRAGEGATLDNLGRIYMARGDYDAALKLLEQSLEIGREIGDRAGEGATLDNLGQIYMARGDYDIALKLLGQSLEIQREIGDRAGMIPTLHNMAHIALTANNPQKAFESWSEAKKLAMETKNALGLFHVGRDFGRLLAQQGDKDAARQLLTIAANAGKAAGFPGVREIEELLEKL